MSNPLPHRPVPADANYKQFMQNTLVIALVCIGLMVGGMFALFSNNVGAGITLFVSGFLIAVARDIATGRPNAQSNDPRKMLKIHTRLGVEANCGQVMLWSDRVSYLGKEYPLDQIIASVETDGTLTSRLSVTRMVTLGVFSLAAPKRNDTRKVHIVVDAGEHGGFVATFPIARQIRATALVQLINQRSGMRSQKSNNQTTQVSQTSMAQVAEDIARLGELLKQGLLTQEEFDKKKRTLLEIE